MLGVGSTLLFVCCRYLSSSSPELYYSNRSPLLSTPASGSSSFIPTPPPNLSQLLVRQQIHRTRKASPSSLPGRLNRALSLGTIPSLARAGECMSAAGSNEKKIRLNSIFHFFCSVFITRMLWLISKERPYHKTIKEKDSFLLCVKSFISIVRLVK